MGNCQAVDNATLLIQHQSGRVDKHYFPVPASEIMKSNPGHYVALLLTTTLYSSPSSSSSSDPNSGGKDGDIPLRVTRIKLLRPTDVLVLGHVYRLVTSQEVMKGLRAKKQAKILHQKQHQQSSGNEDTVRRTSQNKEVNNLVRQRSTSSNIAAAPSAAANKSRIWQPSLNSISEAAGN